jgi:hypothetical protein
LLTWHALRGTCPQKRAHELRAAERRAPVALSRVLLGAGMRLLPAADDVAGSSSGDALRLQLPLRLRSRGGYRSCVSTHGASVGAHFLEVSLPRAGPTGAIRLGFATDAAPLNGPVGAAASPPPDSSAAADASSPCGAHDAFAAGAGVRGATGQTVLAGRAPSDARGPTFGEGDVVRAMRLVVCAHQHRC